MRKTVVPAALAAMLPLAPVQAHHSFAPHFEAERPVRISGTIVAYERRKPQRRRRTGSTGSR